MFKKNIGMAALLLTLLGGINWGLVGILDFNLVTYLLGNWEVAERGAYILVGTSSAYLAVYWKKWKR